MAEDAIARLCVLLTEALQDKNSAIKSPLLQFENFNEETESWSLYIKRLENYFSLQGLAGDSEDVGVKKQELLLHTMGTKTLQLLFNLTSPEEPKVKSYAELISLVQEYLAPKPSEIAEQNRFSKRIQGEGENIANFVADLKKLIKNCNFVCPHCKSSTADVHLRQQFISGVRNTGLLERLIQLREPHNKFQNCVETALAMEAAQKETKEIQKHFTANQMYANLRKDARSSTSSTTTLGNKMEKGNYNCYRCGSTAHLANSCSWQNAICRKCRRKGHLARVCRNGSVRPSYSNRHAAQTTRRKASNAGKQQQINLEPQNNFDAWKTDDNLFVNTVEEILPESKQRPAKILLNCTMDGKALSFELDTGATVTSISEKKFRTLLPNKKILDTNLQLRTYTGEVIKPIGYATVQVQYKNQCIHGNIYVIPGNVDAILGREWLQNLKLDWPGLKQLKTPGSTYNLQDMLHEFSSIFQEGLGKIPNFLGELTLKDNVVPVFRPPREVPYALLDKVLQEIDRLEKLGIFTKVTNSEWGTPLVPVLKSDGSLRLCADYKCTVNQHLKDDKYPIPNVDSLIATMAEGKIFSTLDIRQAYLNMELTDESALIQAVSTPKGVYKVNRLMFGIKTAPAIWQRYISQLLSGIPGVCVFYDDILVHGSSTEEHLGRLRTVFCRLQEANLRVNKKKSQFCKNSIQYLGHVISENGISKSQSKVEAIVNAPEPTNITQLRSWLGLVNYYGKFFEHLSTKLHPLYKLLRSGSKFEWREEQQAAFKLIKKEASSEKILVVYNPSLNLTLATDASPYGISAILSHIMPDGSERPCAYASRSLTAAEKNYSQIDKEATAIYWGVQKFFLYLYGRKFTLITDHKPLVSIFHPQRNLPVLSAQRLLHYAQFLQGFDYSIKYRRSQDHGNADALSRLPLSEGEWKLYKEMVTTFQCEFVSQLPVTHEEIRKETARDPLLRDIANRLKTGMPITEPGFSKRENELSLEQGCITRGARIVIPRTLRKRLLDDLHCGHIGIVKMKALARSYIWWPKIDYDIEAITANCRSCCLQKKEAPKAPIHPWELPKGPWQRIHIDYAGPFLNKMFLIVVDAYTKWPEVVIMNTSTTEKTIEALREIFARFGLPITLVSDNGTNFTSNEFKSFLHQNGIRHKVNAPYHPATNGQAERYVQTIKGTLRKVFQCPGNLNVKLVNFLLQYRKTPNATTGISPAELMLKRDIRTRMDLVRPSPPEDVCKEFDNRHMRTFDVGQTVLARNYNDRNVKWKFGKIVRREGMMHYWISVEGRLWKRHINQLQKCGSVTSTEKASHEHFKPFPEIDMPRQNPETPEGEKKKQGETSIDNRDETSISGTQGPDVSKAPDGTNVNKSIPSQVTPPLRRSSRNRKPVVRLNL